MGRKIKDQEFVVYQVKNVINDNLYIGITSNLKRRMRYHFYDSYKSQAYFHRSIRKYGKKNFEITIIDRVDTWEEACEKEIYWIAKLDTYKNGMNGTLGGDGAFGLVITKEHRDKISKSNKGHICTEKTRLKIGMANKGNIMPEKQKNLLKEVNKGNKYNLGKKRTKEQKERMRQAHLGKKCTEKTKEKMRKAHKNISQEIRDNMSKGQLGRKLSEEHKEKLSKLKRKLSEKQIKEIIKLLNDGMTQIKIAKMFNIAQTVISDIKCRKRYFKNFK